MHARTRRQPLLTFLQMFCLNWILRHHWDSSNLYASAGKDSLRRQALVADWDSWPAVGLVWEKTEKKASEPKHQVKAHAGNGPCCSSACIYVVFAALIVVKPLRKFRTQWWYSLVRLHCDPDLWPLHGGRAFKVQIMITSHPNYSDY